MSRKEQQELIAGYVLGDLSPDEAAAIEQMLADPAIAQDVRQMQQAFELAYAPAEVQPPRRLRESLLDAHQAAHLTSQARSISTVRPAPPNRSLEWSSDGRSEPRRWGGRWGRHLGAIAALCIVGLSLSNYLTWRSLQTLQAERQTEGQATFLTVSLNPAEGSAADGAVTVALDAANLKALLETELPPLPEGQVYALWTVLQADAPFTTDEKGAILTYVFTAEGETAEGEGETIPLPPVYRDSRWIKAIAVTVEDASAPQRHVSSPILIEEL